MRLLVAALCVVPLGGCSALVASTLGDKDDGGPGGMDGGTGTDGPTPDAVELNCTGMRDGTPCGDGLLCLGGLCTPTLCGDQLVDMAAGEECDDGNEMSGDGCEPGVCTFSCADNADCVDADPCNGDESCDTGTHVCAPGAPVDDVPCTLAMGGSGTCSGGLCSPASCGDGTVDSGEDCDDGQNGDNFDGCRDDCLFTCRDTAECDDLDACNGLETCDAGTHACATTVVPVCDDRVDCTMDGCDPASGCTVVFIDEDGDGYSARSCGSGSMFRDGDCDDRDVTRYPGAPELCDSLDNDCDGSTDEDDVMVNCYRDTDADGFGDPSTRMVACSCPSGYIPERPDRLLDCYDRAAAVNPGQMAHQTSPCMGCPMPFDYNCDGRETELFTTGDIGTCGGVGSCVDGWAGRVPSCGVAGTYLDCHRPPLSLMCIEASSITRIQPCL